MPLDSCTMSKLLLFFTIIVPLMLKTAAPHLVNRSERLYLGQLPLGPGPVGAVVVGPALSVHVFYPLQTSASTEATKGAPVSPWTLSGGRWQPTAPSPACSRTHRVCVRARPAPLTSLEAGIHTGCRTDWRRCCGSFPQRREAENHRKRQQNT